MTIFLFKIAHTMQTRNVFIIAISGWLGLTGLCGCGNDASVTPKTNMRELDWSAKSLSNLSDAFADEYPNLERLYLDGNRIQTMPNSIANLTELIELSISNNELTQMPDPIANIGNLEILDLSRNHFSELPAGILKMKNLRTLDLRHNEIKDLPEEIKQLTKLQTVYIYGNPFTSETRARFRDWMPKTQFVWYDPSMDVADKK